VLLSDPAPLDVCGTDLPVQSDVSCIWAVGFGLFWVIIYAISGSTSVLPTARFCGLLNVYFCVSGRAIPRLLLWDKEQKQASYLFYYPGYHFPPCCVLVLASCSLVYVLQQDCPSWLTVFQRQNGF